MSEKPERIIEFERLNLLGKAVFAGGAAVRLTAKAIDAAIERATDVWAEAERAFRDGADPNVDDARIIEERVEEGRQRHQRN